MGLGAVVAASIDGAAEVFGAEAPGPTNARLLSPLIHHHGSAEFASCVSVDASRTATLVVAASYVVISGVVVVKATIPTAAAPQATADAKRATVYGPACVLVPESSNIW
jgi:hypothetical protein